jgi:hypothetical protein
VVIALALLAAGGLGCHSWQRVPITPTLVHHHPRVARLTLANTARLDLRYPAILGDSLIGVAVSRPFGVALTDVTEVRLHRISWTRTAIGWGIPLALLGITIAACAGGNCGTSFGGF